MALSDHVMGYDHIGVPTKDMEASTRFYESIGFKVAFETNNNGIVKFFALKDVVIEVYEKDKTAGERGAVDHIALKVDDIEKAVDEVRKLGLKIIEGPNVLPYWEYGVKYVSVEGPNKEIVEFIQTYTEPQG